MGSNRRVEKVQLKQRKGLDKERLQLNLFQDSSSFLLLFLSTVRLREMGT